MAASIFLWQLKVQLSLLEVQRIQNLKGQSSKVPKFFLSDMAFSGQTLIIRGITMLCILPIFKRYPLVGFDQAPVFFIVVFCSSHRVNSLPSSATAQNFLGRSGASPLQICKSSNANHHGTSSLRKAERIL